MFSYHAPIVAILALIIEVFVTRYELKMLFRCQRPQPRRVANIKQWEGVIYLINIVSIIINSHSLSINSTKRCSVDPSRYELYLAFTGQGVEEQHLAFILMPIFIVVYSLIEIQDTVSGDKVQEHLRNQHNECQELIADLVVTDGTSSEPIQRMSGTDC